MAIAVGRGGSCWRIRPRIESTPCLEDHCCPCLLIFPPAAHAGAVAASLACQLSSLRHSNGAPVCVLYSAHAEAKQHAPPEAQQEPEVQQQQQHEEQHSRQLQGSGAAPAGVVGQGPVVAFNLLRPDGSFVGYRWGAAGCEAPGLVCSATGRWVPAELAVHIQPMTCTLPHCSLCAPAGPRAHWCLLPAPAAALPPPILLQQGAGRGCSRSQGVPGLPVLQLA